MIQYTTSSFIGDGYNCVSARYCQRAGRDRGRPAVYTGWSPVCRFHSDWIRYSRDSIAAGLQSSSNASIQRKNSCHQLNITFTGLRSWELMVNKIQEFSRLHDVPEPVFNNSDSVKKPKFKFSEETNQPVFRISPGDYHQFSRHASCLPFTLEAACAKTCRFSTIGLWKLEAQHWCWLLTSLFSEAGTSTSQFAVNCRRHPTYNKCLWILKNMFHVHCGSWILTSILLLILPLL